MCRWVSVNVLLAVILLVEWPSSSAAQPDTGLLDVQEIGVLISGECCGECSEAGLVCVQQFTLGQFTSPVCRRSACTILDDVATSVLDNDVQTTWSVDGVYDPVAPNEVNLTMVLDETYSFDRVEVYSNNETLPGEILVYSSNGNEFSLTGQLKKETNRLASFQLEEDELQFSQLTLELMDIVDSTISEVFLFVQEGRNDIGCGSCVDHLIDSIQNIMALINSTRLSLSSPVAVERLQLAIQSLQASLECLEGKLLTVSVVLGVEPPIDASIELPPSVVRIDTQLIPSLPIKLDELIDLTTLIDQILFETDRISGLLTQLESALNIANNATSTITESAEIFSNELENFRDQLLSDLELLELAVNESSDILTVIDSRNYDGITDDVTQYNQRAETERIEAESVLATATTNRELVEELETALRDIGSELVLSVNLAVSTEQQALESLNITAEVQQLIIEFNVLLDEAMMLNMTIDSALLEIILSLERGNNLLGEAVHNAQEAGTLLTVISPLVDSLSLDVQQYRRDISSYQLPEPCTITFCTPGGAHAHDLSLNASIIVNSSESVSTVRYAVEFLENLSEREQLFDFSEVNQTAIRAQNVAQEALNMLESVNVAALLFQASDELDGSQMLRDVSLSLFTRATDVEMRASDASQQYSRLNSLASELLAQAENVTDIASSLLTQTGLRSEADTLFVIAERAMNKSLDTNERVVALEEGVLNVASAISQTMDNVESAEQALEDAESKFDSISLFTNTTRLSAEQLVINVSSFVEENEQIISDIDSLIARLSDIHSRVNSINSPIQLLNAGSEESYLSLQPPPGRMINDTIQFETVDLYFWTGEEFTPPAILFYAGPIYEQQEEGDDVSDDDGLATESQEEPEDYFFLSVEAMDLIQLQWSMGGESGLATLPDFDLGRSQIVITRAGSQFELRYGVSTGGLGDPITMGGISNNSLLFQTSERTAFLLGGLPESAQLGFPMSFLDLSEYNPFQGQLQQLLFNGDQWGLWNIRGASRTSFTGNFQRNPLATVNTWHAPRGTLTTAAAISFNGEGYLWVEEFGGVPNFNAGARRMIITTRPNDERDALVMYAYDEMLMLSMEIAYQQGDLRLRIRRHDLDMDLVDYMQESGPTIVAQTSTQGRQIVIFFIEGVGFQVNGVQFVQRTTARFFNNLQNVRVWYGGVREDLLESPFIPQLTNTSYCGCIDIVTMDAVTRDVFIGEHFKRQYLNSPLQRGFSATCLRTTYTREMSLDGSPESYLSYNYLSLVTHPNSPIVGASTGTGPTTLSLAFLPQSNDGIILAALDETEVVYAVMRDGQLEVGVGDVLLTSSVDVSTGEWHYLFIELSDDLYTLYLDGVEQQSTNSAPGFDFQFQSSPGVGGPALFVGGVDPGLISAIETLPPFSGCMSDFAYGFRAMSFLNLALVTDRRYPSGISYHSCLLDDDSSDPLLPVIPQSLQPRTCLSPPPVTLSDTVGGFHRETQLTTSNIIGLLQRSWSLSMILKQSEDGHVMTLNSTMGHRISLSIRDARPVLILSEGDNATFDAQEAVGGELEENIFTTLVIRCEVESALSSVTCSLLVGGDIVMPSLQAPFSDAPFFTPLLPISFGLISDSNGTKTQSFVGCIDELAINSDSSGFDGVRTETPCYNSTETGLGFTGISSIGEVVSCEDVSVMLNFKPLLDNGLLMMLTGNNEELTPIAAVGLFNGRVIVSNFNDSSVSYTLGNMSVCNSEYHSLSFASDGISASVRLASGDDESFDTTIIPVPLQSNGSGCLLTIGNTPGGLAIAKGSNLFSFLLSDDVDPDGTPPGFSGCIQDLIINNTTLEASSSTVFMEDVLLGLCPSN